MRILVAAIVVAALGRPSHADDSPKTKADELFEEGVALRNKGAFKEACVKFEEAMKHDERAIGTLLNLALCAEKFDHFATAVHLYSEARDRAREQGLAEHQKAAEEHIALLEPQVSHLTVKLVEPLPATKVLIDDRVVALTELDKLPIDAGVRAISVSAPGRLPYETTITIAIAKDASLDIPALGKPVTVSSRRTIGKLSVIGGGVLLGAGLGLGLYAKSMYDAQFDAHTDAMGGQYFPCRADKMCDSGGQKQTEKARTIGVVGSVIGGVGLAAIGVGVALWVMSPTTAEHPAQVSVVPVASPDQIGFAAVGHF